APVAIDPIASAEASSASLVAGMRERCGGRLRRRGGRDAWWVGRLRGAGDECGIDAPWRFGFGCRGDSRGRFATACQKTRRHFTDPASFGGPILPQHAWRSSEFAF